MADTEPTQAETTVTGEAEQEPSESGRNKEEFVVSFEEGPLGLEFDGATVVAVLGGGQAEVNGVRPKDQLVAIGSEPLPPVEEVEKAKQVIRQKCELPRPIVFSFSRREPVSPREVHPEIPQELPQDLPTVCPRCGADLTLSNNVGRFCAECGWDVTKTPPPSPKPKAAAKARMSSSLVQVVFEGRIGIVFTDNGLVLGTMYDSPARLAGVKPGWILTEIDGKPVRPGDSQEKIGKLFARAMDDKDSFEVTFDFSSDRDGGQKVEGWGVLDLDESIAIHQEPDTSSRILGDKAAGSILFGTRRGDWVRLAGHPGYVLIKSPMKGRFLERATSPHVWVVDKDVKEINWEEVNTYEVTEEAKKFETMVGQDLKHFIDAESDMDLKAMLRQSIGWETSERNEEIEVDSLMRYLLHKDKDNRLCMSLCWNLVFMFVYVITCLHHEDFASSALLQREVHSMLTGTSFEGVDKDPTRAGHKIFQDIDNIEDIYNFLEQALLPMFLLPSQLIQQGRHAEATRVLRYNRLIGGIQMQQKRRKVKPCNEAWPNLGPFLPDTERQPILETFDCYPDQFYVDMSDDCFGPLHYTIRQPGQRYSLPSGFCADKSLEGYTATGRRMPESREQDSDSSWTLSNPIEAFVRKDMRSPLMHRIASLSSRWWEQAAPINASEKFAGDYMRKIKALANRKPKATTPRERWQKQRWGRSKQKEKDRSEQTENHQTERSSGAPPRRMRVARRRKSTKTPVSLAWYPGLKDHERALAYSVLLNSGAGLEEALVRTNWLKNNHWLDRQSQWLGVRLFMLNPELGMYNHASINVYFGTGGEVVQMVETHTFAAEPFKSSIIPLDILLCFLIVGTWFEFWGKVVISLRNRTILHFLRNGWHWVHAATAHGGFVLLGFWFLQYGSMENLKDEILGLGSCGARPVALTNTSVWPNSYQWELPLPIAEDVGGMTPDDVRYTECLHELHDAAYSHAHLLKAYRVYLSMFAVFLIVRFFRVFSMQPKLAMVTNTLYYAWDQILHHLIVFITMLLSFGLAGIFVFGRHDPSFAEIGLAVSQCFIVMLGEFDTEVMAKENPLTAMLWFYSFTVVVSFLMINCLMAIVMDVYVEVKASACNIQTVWDHAWEMFMDLLTAHSIVNIKVVMAAIEKHIRPGESSKVDAEVLTKLVPGMSDRQSVHLITEAIARKREEELNGHSLSNALIVTGSVNVMVHKVLGQLDVLIDGMVAQRDAFRVVEDKICGGEAPQGPLHLECQAFADRKAAIEATLANMERFLEDSACWNAYRTQEMHEHLGKIEERLQQGKKKLQTAQPPTENKLPMPEPVPPAPFPKRKQQTQGDETIWSM